MPYAVNRETYAVVPYFCFSKRAVPDYHHPVDARLLRGDGKSTTFDPRPTAFGGFVRRTAHKITMLWRFYVGPAFSLAFR